MDRYDADALGGLLSSTNYATIPLLASSSSSPTTKHLVQQVPVPVGPTKVSGHNNTSRGGGDFEGPQPSEKNDNGELSWEEQQPLLLADFCPAEGPLNNNEAGAAAATSTTDQEEDERTTPWWCSSGFSRFQFVSLMLLLAVVWCSGILFGTFIFGHYLFAILISDMKRWNTLLPSLYNKHRPIAMTGMGAHFLGGAITLILGAVQFIPGLRKQYPLMHRWTGRVYIVCALMTAVGGFTYIALNGTIGGPVMDVAFALYGALVVLASIQTYRYAALSHQYEQHELWGWRLYSLMIASWLYRMEYIVAELLGIPNDYKHYSYPLDHVMDFFFYVPNLIVVEVVWHLRRSPFGVNVWVWNLFAVLMLIASLILLCTTAMNAAIIWIPGIRGKLANSPYFHHHDDGDDHVGL